MPPAMEEVAQNVVTTFKEAKARTFQPHRDNDELTMALHNPEHPGRAHGIGVVPWKVAWAGDSTYKTIAKARRNKKTNSMPYKMT
jgi:hypothetical protein